MYRDNHMNCAACGGVLNQRGSVDQCPACSGTLVAKAILEEMVQRMNDGASGDSLALEAASVGTETRSCPACEKPMAPVLFASVTVDQCEDHGFWFDPEELQEALGKIGAEKPEPKTVSFWTAIIGWLMSPRSGAGADFRAIFNDEHLDHGGWSPKIPEE